MNLQRKIGYWSTDYKIIYFGLAGFVFHLIDEMLHGYGTPPTVVYLVIALSVIIYPFLEQFPRGIVTIILGLAIIAGMSGGHFIPFLTTGSTEGIVTAVITSLVGLYVVGYGIKLVMSANAKKK